MQNNNENIKINSNKVMVIKNFLLITITLSFIISLFTYLTINFAFKKQITQIKNIFSTIATRASNITAEPIAIDTNSDVVSSEFEDYFSADNSTDNKPIGTTDYTKIQITNYPNYGSKYGDVSFPAISLNLPLYFGDTLQILKNGGIGHSSGSYFPRRRCFYYSLRSQYSKSFKKGGKFKNWGYSSYKNNLWRV